MLAQPPHSGSLTLSLSCSQFSQRRKRRPDSPWTRLPCPALPQSWPPEGTCETPLAPAPELFSCPHLLLLAKGHSRASRAENVLKKIKAPSRGELKCVSDYRSGWQFRVPFIKAAIRQIIYHHGFFTAVSQAAITKGNRFISWAPKQDRDGWWNLQAGGFQHRVAIISQWELSRVELGSKWPLLKMVVERGPDPLPGREVGISWQ